MAAKLEISTVVGCRMMCKVCPQSLHVKKFAERSREYRMELATFKACLDKVPSSVEVDFAGMAEPWLNPEATAMVEYASGRGHEVEIFSTLSGMTIEDVSRLSKIRLKSTLCIHLPDTDGDMRLDVNRDYLRVLEECIRVIPCHFTVFGKVHPLVRPVVAARINKLGKAEVSDDSPGAISRAGNLFSKKIARKTGKLECGACGPKIDHNVLLPNGDVVLCCMVYDLKHTLGNLLTGSYESLFSGPEYARVARGLSGDETVDLACRSCELSVPA